MKVRVEIVIDADREVVWRELGSANDSPLWRPTTVTEERKPDFMAGIYESDSGKAVVVNHFESLGEARTRWIVYANHRLSGLTKLRALFGRNPLVRRTEDDMQRFKLRVESRIAEETK